MHYGLPETLHNTLKSTYNAANCSASASSRELAVPTCGTMAPVTGLRKGSRLVALEMDVSTSRSVRDISEVWKVYLYSIHRTCVGHLLAIRTGVFDRPISRRCFEFIWRDVYISTLSNLGLGSLQRMVPARIQAARFCRALHGSPASSYVKVSRAFLRDFWSSSAVAFVDHADESWSSFAQKRKRVSYPD